jgi:hypothetical protein
MAFAELSSDGTSNSTTPVEMVAAPGASTKRIIKSMTVYNADSAAATVTITFDNNVNERIINKTTLDAGDQLYIDDVIVLPDTTSSINLVLAGAVSATQLDWTAHYGDST